MKRTLLTAAALSLAFTASLYADVTIKQTGTAKVMGMNNTMATTTYVKGMKMRVDSVMGDKTMTTIYDVENQKMYIFDSKKKEADVWDMAAFSQEMSKTVQTGEITSSIKPNGQTKQIAGKTASGYDLEITVPATAGAAGSLTMKLTGPVWVVKGAPGTADYAAFYKAAAEKGWIFQDPKTAKASPGQAKATAKMYEDFASLGGLPYESQTDMKAAGEGPMAGMMAKAMNVSMTSTTESVETGTLAAELFAPPPGYKLNVRK